MASPAVAKVLSEVQHLTDNELQELAELLEAERAIRETQLRASDPLMAIIGGWASMGDEEIDAFDAAIQQSRSGMGREVVLGE